MAAENNIQFFEAPFQYSIGEFSSNVNLSYHKLINTRPVKIPFMNTGFETSFSQAYNEKGDKSYFAIKKREGFVRCNQLDSLFDPVLGSEWYVTDHQIVNGTRFVMGLSSDGYKLMVAIQRPGYQTGCKKRPYDVCNGNWEAIRPTSATMSYYDTEPCAYHKFQKIKTLQNTSGEETRSKPRLYIGNYITNAGAVTAVLFNKDRTIIDGLKTGDFIQVYSSDNGDIVVGQSLQLGEFDAEHGWYNMGYGQWVGITDKTTDIIYDIDLKAIGTLYYQGEVTVNIYDEVKEGIAFSGYDKNRHRDNNGLFEWNGEKFTFIQQTDLEGTFVTSMTEDQDGLIYTTDNGYINFLRPRGDFMQDLGGTIYSTNKLYGGWDLARSCGDYIFLFGPSSIGIAYKLGTDAKGDYIWDTQILDRNVGYYCKDSVMVYNEELYMVDSKRRFVKMDLEASYNNAVRPQFKLQMTDMSLHWINTDMRNLDYDRGDRVYLAKDDFRIYLIIQDSANNKDEEATNTKVLVYEDEYKYWHRRYLCDTDIRGFKDGEWFGFSGMYVNKGNKDGSKSIKQIISLTFGDTSYFTWKELIWIKMAIGYHSKISADTIFSLRTDGGGYSSTIKMNTLHEVMYVKAINELRESGKTDPKDLQTLFHAMPIGVGVYAGNGVGLIKDRYRTAMTEFDQYCSYENPVTYYINNCCDVKPGSKESDNGCTMEAPKANTQNFGSDRLQYHYNIAKYATIQLKTNQQGQNFYLELIANNDDEIEFIGFMIGWMFMDNNFDAVCNMPYYLTTPKDSLPGMMGK